MNPIDFNSVFSSFVGVFQQNTDGVVPLKKGVPPVTLPPIDAGGNQGAGILSAPVPNSVDAQGNPAYRVPSWSGIGWTPEEVKKFWNDFGQVQIKGFGWNVFLVLLLLIAFFVILTGETNPINAYERLKPI